ncbi:MAG: DNA-binding response regulator [Deltaproteobacteria bacterium HGW-Deltaproteobacteria-21]|nr:MAG: DNA-binding response regulator [Deltaproteobacteria bacterium HGW-Deltaproteobacteria-21]
MAYKTNSLVTEGAELSPGSSGTMESRKGETAARLGRMAPPVMPAAGPGISRSPEGKEMEDSTLETTKILVIDDQAMIREGLRDMFLRQRGIQVIGEESDPQGAARFAAELQPDVVIMGISGTDRNAISSIREIVARGKTRVIVILRNLNKEFVEEILRSRASAYLAKDSPFDELDRAVQTAIKGQTYITPMIAGVVIDGYISQQTGGAPNSGLSEREVEVLKAICEGESTRDIALRLRVSVKTIETHRRRMMEKLQIFNVAELIKHAIRMGITSV